MSDLSPSPANDGDDAAWAEIERLGRESGHVVCRCPNCGARCSVAVRNSSGTRRSAPSVGWPWCRVCVTVPARPPRMAHGPRVEPIGDVDLVAPIPPPSITAVKRALWRARRWDDADGPEPA